MFRSRFMFSTVLAMMLLSTARVVVVAQDLEDEIPQQELITDEIPEQQAVAAEELDREVIVDRYANGQPQIEREVALDHDENFVNHGNMRLYNSKGVFVGGGEYEWGRRIGKWTRIYNQASEAPVFKQLSLRGFKAPFISETTFVDDKLDGIWFITDAAGKLIVQWEFSKGDRDGMWTWYSSAGDVTQQVTYRDGVIDGDVLAFRGKEEAKVLQRYIDGRLLTPDVEKYANGRAKKQGQVLMPKAITKVNVDWWAGTVQETTVRTEGDAVRHGEYKHWFENGRPQMTGTYNVGRETGAFVWYYENGLKQTEGFFVDGQREGNWNEWYANGQVKGTGVYASGKRSGKWRTWFDNGMRQRDAAFRGGQQIGSVRIWDRNGARVFEELQREQGVADGKGTDKVTR